MTDTTTDIATLPPADRALIVLNSTKTEESLKAMVEEAATITEIKDKTGREQAHRVGMKLKTARTTIAKTGKAARDDATAFAKAVIDEEKRLIAITEGEEKRVLGLRDAFDEKLEAERRAAEALRAEIKAKIDGIRGLPLALAGASSDEILAERDALAGFTPTPDVFGDQTEDCGAAIGEAITQLEDLHARVLAQETAAAALEAARRQAEEALIAERAAIEAERAALAKERAELEALRAAAQAPVLVEPQPEADELEDVRPGPVLSVASPGAEIELPAEDVTEFVTTDEPVPESDWRIRQAAIHTADQFEAMAAKVNQCGFSAFANDLRNVAATLRDGGLDTALANADREALIAADTLLLNATLNAIDALSEQKEAA